MVLFFHLSPAVYRQRRSDEHGLQEGCQLPVLQRAQLALDQLAAAVSEAHVQVQQQEGEEAEEVVGDKPARRGSPTGGPF